MKKSILLFVLSFFILFTSYSKPNKKTKFKFTVLYNQTDAVKDLGNKDFSDISGLEIVKDMSTGWNLGNTMDATGGRGLSTERSWGMPSTTQDMIKKLSESGIKSIRIPVSWSKHFVDKQYTLDPAWMNRVKEIVDWAIEEDMYVILNTHHDNFATDIVVPACKGYYPTDKNYEESERFVTNVWAQIALAFNNGYDEHLVFETLNEPRLRGTPCEWQFSPSDPYCLEGANNLNKLNQQIVNVVRASGGNNAKRLIMVPGLQCSPNSVLSSAFVVPTDIVEGKIAVAVHMYTPYIFAGQSPGTAKFTPKIQADFCNDFKRLNDKFIANNIPVVIGEYGAVNKNNPEDRAAWFAAFIKYSRKYGMSAFLWDNQLAYPKGDDSSECFGYFDRNNLEWFFPEILDAIISNVNAE